MDVSTVPSRFLILFSKWVAPTCLTEEKAMIEAYNSRRLEGPWGMEKESEAYLDCAEKAYV